MRTFATLALLAVTASAGCGKKPEPAVATDGSPATETEGIGDVARFQGRWKLDKVELVPGGNSPEIDSVSADDLNRVGVTVTGKLLKLTRRGKDWENEQYFILAPVAGKSPEALDLIESDHTATTAPRTVPSAKNGKPFMMELDRPRYAAIYRFEGEALVIALPFEEDNQRPTEFKPSLMSVGSRKIPVAVVHLKKK